MSACIPVRARSLSGLGFSSCIPVRARSLSPTTILWCIVRVVSSQRGLITINSSNLACSVVQRGFECLLRTTSLVRTSIDDMIFMTTVIFKRRL